MLHATIVHDLVTMGIPVGEKLIRTLGIYAGLLILLRLSGKRDLAQLNTFDLVVLLLLSNVVQNAIIGNDNSLVGGLIGASALLAVNAVLVRIARRSDLAVTVLEGTPTVLVRDGTIDTRAIAREGLRGDDVLAALRRQGADSVDDVAEARLEPGGAITVQFKPGKEDATREDIARLEEKLDRLLAAAG